MKHEEFRLKRPVRPNLTEVDFDESRKDLDAQHAWKNLGGKTLVEAYELFMTNPLNFQEDYAWMGSRAFDYYFPVQDHYIRSAGADNGPEDYEVQHLSSCIASQFAMIHGEPSIETQREIVELVQFVLTSLDRFAPGVKAQRGIERSWKALQSKLNQG